ncbi:MAG: glutamyl-Q tRNA(Asp) synthetase [Paraglaciecola sp.]|jgi:glutamyl-Q tRNA(Asp) synthetase
MSKLAFPITASSKPGYVGRFAPTPSGPLHFGSLVAALASFLQAKQHQGQWLLRIEDIDPPREQAGAASMILHTLEQHGLYWDGEVQYQSQRTELYEQTLNWLEQNNHCYHCQCSRKQLRAQGADSSCPCLSLKLTASECSIRFKNRSPVVGFSDRLLGQVTFEKVHCHGDFLVKRRDGLYAYQLAVVVDDIEQGITEVVRGADLLQATAYQLALYQAFTQAPPAYLHFPVVVSEPGKKLSKQNHAAAVANTNAVRNIVDALEFLGLLVPLEIHQAGISKLLGWATNEWKNRTVSVKTERIDNRIGGPDSI